MIRWPGVIKPGTIIRHTVSNLDWFPTILSMAGLKTDAVWKLRGRDMTPLLRGRKPPQWDNTYFAEYSTHHQSHTRMRMISNGQWKLIRDFMNPRRDELYHLAKDPGESRNLIRSQDPSIKRTVAMLHKHLVDRMAAHGDKLQQSR